MLRVCSSTLLISVSFLSLGCAPQLSFLYAWTDIFIRLPFVIYIHTHTFLFIFLSSFIFEPDYIDYALHSAPFIHSFDAFSLLSSCIDAFYLSAFAHTCMYKKKSLSAFSFRSSPFMYFLARFLLYSLPSIDF
jgi:hypothetical protein